MYEKCALLTYYTLTPLHMGTGSSVYYIDLPIQRERHTSFPIMAGSGIKGVFRNLAERRWEEKTVNDIFGYEEAHEGASKIALTDAKILLYPVRSLRSTFTWITCPLVLRRFKEELESLSQKVEWEIPKVEDNKALLCENSSLKIDEKHIGLEEFVFDSEESKEAKAIADFMGKYLPKISMVSTLPERLAIVSDNVFADFVNYAVEIRTRIRIDQITGTVQEGALFTMEFVPSEAI
ncbi:MAG: type III-B CRISPR module RAMP protein Cmr4, partial [Aquificaceae bacterium]